MHPLKAARKARNLSLNGLAIKIGVCGRWQVCKWEAGLWIPRADRAEKLASVLGFESAEQVMQMCLEWKKWNTV